MDGNRRFTREKMIEGRQGYMLGLKQLMEVKIRKQIKVYYYLNNFPNLMFFFISI